MNPTITSENNAEDQDKGPLIEQSAPIVDSNDAGTHGNKTEIEKEREVTAGTSDEEDGGEGEEDGESTQLFRIDSGLLPFPEKLMVLLDGNTASDAMWWLPDGDSFCIIPTVFAEQVLDKHFSGTKFESFTRKLNRSVASRCLANSQSCRAKVKETLTYNMFSSFRYHRWGFKRVAGQRVPANTIAYYNKHFLRGKPKLLKNMNGGKTKFVSAREKRMRAQLKRERDQHQQEEAMYQTTSPGGVAGATTAAADPLVGFMGGAAPGISSSPFASGSLLSGTSANNPAALHALLASRQILFQRQAQEIRLAEQVLAAEFSARKQREELQMRLFQQRGVGLSDQATENALLRRVLHHPSQLQGASAASTTGAVGNLASLEQLLAVRQQMAMANGALPTASGNLIDRLLAQRMSINASNASDPFMHLARRMDHRLPLPGDVGRQNESKAGSPPATGGTGQIDQELFKRYLMEEERRQKGL